MKFGGHMPSPDQLNWAENLIKNAIVKAFSADNEESEEDMEELR